MNKKFIMKKAVAMAKKMEGDWTARMSLALKAVWAIVKKAKEENKAEREEVRFTEWAKYGHHRVYFEGAFHFETTVWNQITQQKVRALKSVHIKGFYDVEKGYIKFEKCEKKNLKLAINYVYSKIATMQFEKTAQKAKKESVA